MAWLAAAAPYIGIATTAVSAYSSIQQGKAREAQAQLAAMQAERAADREQAAAQREAQNERRRAKLVRSRALAVAASSGAGASDPTVENILSGIDAEGEYNALTALYSGDTTSQGMRAQADATRREGKAYRSAGNIGAAVTALRGIDDFYERKSFYDKYAT